MKKITNKKKLSLATILTTILLFPFKVMGQFREDMYQDLYWVPQTKYWIPAPSIDIQELYWVPSYVTPLWWAAIKIVQRVLIWVTFIVWIVNLIKIKKTKDKEEKKEKLKRFIITICILIVLIIASFIIIQLLKR